MTKYIELEAAIDAVIETYYDTPDINLNESRLEAALQSVPSADVAPVVHGRWIERQTPHAMGGISAKCSVCTKSVQYLGNPLSYCPQLRSEDGRRWDNG